MKNYRRNRIIVKVIFHGNPFNVVAANTSIYYGH